MILMLHDFIKTFGACQNWGSFEINPLRSGLCDHAANVDELGGRFAVSVLVDLALLTSANGSFS